MSNLSIDPVGRMLADVSYYGDTDNVNINLSPEEIKDKIKPPFLPFMGKCDLQKVHVGFFYKEGRMKEIEICCFFEFTEPAFDNKGRQWLSYKINCDNKTIQKDAYGTIIYGAERGLKPVYYIRDEKGILIPKIKEDRVQSDENMFITGDDKKLIEKILNITLGKINNPTAKEILSGSIGQVNTFKYIPSPTLKTTTVDVDASELLKSEAGKTVYFLKKLFKSKDKALVNISCKGDKLENITGEFIQGDSRGMFRIDVCNYRPDAMKRGRSSTILIPFENDSKTLTLHMGDVGSEGMPPSELEIMTVKEEAGNITIDLPLYMQDRSKKFFLKMIELAVKSTKDSKIKEVLKEAILKIQNYSVDIVEKEGGFHIEFRKGHK